MIDPNTKLRVKEAVDLAALIGRDVPLKKAGSEWKGLCPFHSETSPSFTVVPAKGIYHCFGCSATGDCFTWVEKRRGLQFIDALRVLAAEVGIAVDVARSAALDAKLVRPGPLPAKREGMEREKFRPVVKGSSVYDYLVSERCLSPNVLTKSRVCETHAKDHFFREGGADWQAIAFQYLVVANGKWVAEVFKCLDLFRPDTGSGKCKKIEWRHPRGRQSVLYGMDTVPDNAETLIICEGEIDKLSWNTYGFEQAVSVPSGAGSLGWIESCWAWLERFKTIYLSFDADESGQRRVMEIVERLGRERCAVVAMPQPGGRHLKDVNECLVAGVEIEVMRNAIASAVIWKPERLKEVLDFQGAIWEKFFPSDSRLAGLGLPWGNAAGKGLPFHFRPGEVTVWSGFNGHGKSQVLNHVAVDMASVGERILIVSLEMPAEETYRRMIRMVLARRDVITKQEKDVFVEKCLRWFVNRVWVYDQVGMADLDDVLTVCEYARKRYGVTQFVFDSLMRFVVDCGDEQWEAQKLFMDKLVTFAAVHKCHVHLVAHSKKLRSEAEYPRKSDIAGSYSISNLAWNVIVVWRNRAKEESRQALVDDIDGHGGYDAAPAELRQKLADLEEEGDAYLIVDKQRGGEGDCPVHWLWFDRASLQFLSRGQKAKCYADICAQQEEEHAI